MLKGKTHRIVGISLFGALAYILMLFAFPVIPAFSYLKVDFSDVSLLISFLIYGPVGGFMSTLIRTILHYIQTGGDMGYPIGDMASLLASVSYCLPVYLIVKRAKTKTGLITALFVGTLTMTIVLTIANWFIITPLYLYILNFSVGNLRDYIVIGVVPFNIIKGFIISAAILIILPKLKPWLVKQYKFMAIK